MKSLTTYLTMNVPSKMAFQNITPQVADAVRASGVQEGLVLVNTMHITASVFINDDERGLHDDFGKWLDEHGHTLGRPPARNCKTDPLAVQAMHGIAGAFGQDLIVSDQRTVDVGEQKRDLAGLRHVLRSLPTLIVPIGSSVRSTAVSVGLKTNLFTSR